MGRVVNASTDGAYVFPGEVSYGASKLVLEGYARSAAVELGPLGITVNTVSLGAVQTGWISPEISPGLWSQAVRYRLSSAWSTSRNVSSAQPHESVTPEPPWP